MLVDDTDRHDDARILVTLHHAIRDGRAARDGKPQTLSKRLQFVWLHEVGSANNGGPAPYLDCRAPTAEEQDGIGETLGAPWLREPLEERARTLAVTDLAPRHLEEAGEPCLAILDRIETAIRERIRREIVHLQHRALDLEAEEKASKHPRLNSENVRRQAEALADRLEHRLADIARQRDLAPLPPEVCGAALSCPRDFSAGKRRATPPSPGRHEGTTVG